VREITAEWLERYNEITPHDALGSLPPARYRERLLATETPDSAVTKEFLSCESGWSKTIRRPL